MIDLSDIQEPNRPVFGYTGIEIDAAGRFKITGFKGQRDELHAYQPTEFFERQGANPLSRGHLRA